MDDPFVFVADPRFAVQAQEQYSAHAEEEVEFTTLARNGGLFMRPIEHSHNVSFLEFMKEKFDGAYTAHGPRLL
jgi:hypothetical protein